MTYDANIHKRRSIRLKEYDYSQEGLYFITICVNVGANCIRPNIFGDVGANCIRPHIFGDVGANCIRPHIFGDVGANCIRPHIFGDVGANCIRPHIFGDVVNGEMILNDAGKIAYNEWFKTPDIRSNVQLDAFVVMPNHVHGIIVITNDDTRGVCNTQGVCDTRGVCNTRGVCDTRGVCNTPLRSPSNTVGAIVRGYKSAVTKQLKQLGYTCAIWQRNYFEHIIRNTKDCNNIVEYITHNPANWKQDQFYMT